jgi:YegS/Rv2252/BmrU family lipid kinase
VKPLVIVNPRSGGGRTGRTLPELKRVIENRLGEVDVAMTERMGHASEIAERAVKEGRERLIAVGGDGTLSECTDGILRAGGGDAVVLGLVGQGTGGDFRKTLGLEHRLEAYLDAIAEGHERRLDAGRARFVGHDGAPRQRHFVNILSAGMGGLVDDHVSRASRWLPGTAAYWVSSLRALLEIVPGQVRCTIGLGAEERVETLSTYMLAVCNGRYFGSGMHVAPMAHVDDGVFEVVSMSAPGKIAFATRSQAIYEGKHLGQDGVTHFKCDRIRIELQNAAAKKTFLLDVDGEPLGAPPLDIAVLPGAVRMLAPASKA